jgi:UDP-3-O-[3-hydroxymyristoyl] N-acetylglucosamine deacetylase
MTPSKMLTQAVGTISGVGLFSGKMCRVTIEPGDGRGIVIASGPVLATRGMVAASVLHVGYATQWAGLPPGVPIRNTTIDAGGVTVGTVEHVMAALAGLGIWDAQLRVEGPEIPILDASARGFVEALRPALQSAPLSVEPITLTKRIEVREGEATIIAEPSDELSYTYNLDYGPTSPLKPQSATWRGDPADFATNIAPARTFSLRAEAQAAQRAGLFKHLSPRDMLVIGDDGAPIDNTWRLDNEPARHKLLDLIGDLALLGRPLLAQVTATRSGHRLTHDLCRAILG